MEAILQTKRNCHHNDKKISLQIMEKEEDIHSMGRCTHITINGRNKKKLTIISAYRSYNTTI